ncbi:Receptor-like protein, partial [Drosera capensis]
LRACNFQGTIPHSLGNLTLLNTLNLRACNFQGTIPHSLGNLTLLNTLSLGANNLTGEIPSSLAALTDLVYLVLDGNHLTGRIPPWISTLEELNTLTLGLNNFAGPVGFNTFLQLKQLQYLGLQNIELAFPAKTYQSSVYPQFGELILRGCGLTRFPDFLRNQNSLGFLILDDNKIHGAIPKWLWNISRETLTVLWIDNNFLTGFGEHPKILPWTNLDSLALNGNDLKGSFPLPSLLLGEYFLADNELNGQIPSLICNSTLKSIDLSLNRFSGEIPQCLGSLSRSLQYLALGINDLNGSIPEGFPEDCELQIINLRNNRLAGRIPRSLANCSSLELLDLGGNQINDVFPSWFVDLPELQALGLGSNNLHGGLPAKLDTVFRKLRIIDLSANAFSGYLSK